VHYFSLKITAKASMALVASNVQKKKKVAKWGLEIKEI
jgi:hypothetical protein